jgi:hypothetical protein
VSFPKERRWLFWEMSPARVDLTRDAHYVMARVLEHGMLDDVRWLVRTYGLERIHAFLRDVGHPELSPRTLSFWRAFFRAGEEPWADRRSWRMANGVPWPC